MVLLESDLGDGADAGLSHASGGTFTGLGEGPSFALAGLLRRSLGLGGGSPGMWTLPRALTSLARGLQSELWWPAGFCDAVWSVLLNEGSCGERCLVQLVALFRSYDSALRAGSFDDPLQAQGSGCSGPRLSGEVGSGGCSHDIE